MHKEFEWMAKNKVEYIDNADSNFGLYKDRDTFFIIKNNIKKFMIKDLSWKNYGSRIYNKISKIV